MKVRLSLRLIGIIVIVGLILCCSSPAGNGNGNGDGDGDQYDPVLSEQLTNEGIALMKVQDWDGALSKFSEAVLKNPVNGRAVIGYSALNIASIMSDPNVVTLAKNKLGLADYPSTMNKILAPDSWMIPLKSPYSCLMPRITGEAAFDGKVDGSLEDDIIDPKERMLAFAAYFMTHNTGFTNLVNTVSTALGARLDAAIAAIKAAPDDMKFTLTWDMFFDVQPTAESNAWPYKNGSPMEIAIGKAEILAIAAGMEAVKGLTYLAQVYNLSLPLGDYWTAFNPVDGTMTNPDVTKKPFVTFLKLNTDAAAKLRMAKDSYTGAIADLKTAIDAVRANRAGFFLSTDPIMGTFPDMPSWLDFEMILRTSKKFATVVDYSIDTKTCAYLPISFPSGFDPDTNWPTGITQNSSIGINFGTYFDTPMNLFTTLIELEANGEPVYQRFASGDFTPVTQGYMTGLGNNFTGNRADFQLRVPDITLGGVVPIENLPVDNPATRYQFSMSWNDNVVSDGKWTWTDTIVANGVFDPGEGEWIYSASCLPQLEGFFIQIPLNAAYGGDPEAYYSTTSDVPSALLDAYLATINQTPQYYAALRAALTSFGGFDRPTATFFYVKGASLFFPFTPAFIAWNSFTAAGTPGTDPSGNPMTSKGSVWWFGAAMLHDMLLPTP